MIIPDDPQQWADASIPREFNLDRVVRQFFIVDLFSIVTIAYFTGVFFILFRSRIVAGLLAAIVFLACVVYILIIARTFVMQLFRPSLSAVVIGSRIWNRLWAWHQAVLSETLVINNTELDPADHWGRWQGGPANMVINDGYAVYVELGNFFLRTRGPRLPLPELDARETIKAIVDLKPQYLEFSTHAWTKDGIKVELKTRIVARIGADYSPDAPITRQLFPFNPLSVRQAVEYTAVRERDRKLSEVDWRDGAIGRITGLIGHHISMYRLDELYLTERGDGQILSAAVLEQLCQTANIGLRNNGIHLTSIQITETQIPEDVYGQRLDVWKSGKDSVITRIHAQANAYETRVMETARARAQRDLIVSITRSLAAIPPTQLCEAAQLSMAKILDRGLRDPLVKGMLSDDTQDLLKDLLF
jgi:hypothetical protein